MKKRLWSLLLVTMLTSMTMTGCGQAMRSVGTTGVSASTGSANPVLTPEEARQIALQHAGLTEDQVIGLHAQYEIEHGTPIYDVEFHHRMWEYDYTRDCVLRQGLACCGACEQFPCHTIMSQPRTTVLDRDWLRWKKESSTNR